MTYFCKRKMNLTLNSLYLFISCLISFNYRNFELYKIIFFSLSIIFIRLKIHFKTFIQNKPNKNYNVYITFYKLIIFYFINKLRFHLYIIFSFTYITFCKFHFITSRYQLFSFPYLGLKLIKL